MYEVIDNNNPFASNLRLKSFLTSYGRCHIGEIIIKAGLENVKRVHTDGVVFKKDIDLDIDNFIREKKTTGLICWKSINDYDASQTL